VEGVVDLGEEVPQGRRVGYEMEQRHADDCGGGVGSC